MIKCCIQVRDGSYGPLPIKFMSEMKQNTSRVGRSRDYITACLKFSTVRNRDLVSPLAWLGSDCKCLFPFAITHDLQDPEKDWDNSDFTDV